MSWGSVLHCLLIGGPLQFVSRTKSTIRCVTTLFKFNVVCQTFLCVSVFHWADSHTDKSLDRQQKKDRLQLHSHYLSMWSFLQYSSHLLPPCKSCCISADAMVQQYMNNLYHETIFAEASVSSILTGFVALESWEEFVRLQKIPSLHCNQQILFFPHDNQRNKETATTKDACIVLECSFRQTGSWQGVNESQPWDVWEHRWTKEPPVGWSRSFDSYGC